MTHLDVHKLAPNAQIFTELVHEPNLKFFRKDHVLGGQPAKKKRIYFSSFFLFIFFSSSFSFASSGRALYHLLILFYFFFDAEKD